ncbi:MAG TPA: 3-oxoacyl-ACP reductase [Myxococcales bacterium]|nr:3-oxoacyl-ACP reductase [Myxococcales bacterium]
MSGDTLLNLSNRPTARRMMNLVGLPAPQPLKRSEGPWKQYPLQDEKIVLNAKENSLNKALLEMGATPTMSTLDEDERIQGLVFDARTLETLASLKELYDFFHPLIRKLKKCGRVVLLGHPPEEASSAETAATRQALVGFTKSLAKELGRKGGTANLIMLHHKAENQLNGPLRFLLSERSAFVSGQVLSLHPATQAPIWLQPLAEKTAVVTGAARGIGEATARRLAQEGARVILLDIPAESDVLEVLAMSLEGTPLPLDITDENAAKRILEVGDGTIDIIVHNAGITRDKTLGRMNEERWAFPLNVNLESVWRVTERLLDAGGIPTGGKVVLVSSIAGIAGNAGQTNYAASKAGIIGLTHWYGAALKEKGICLNAVAPGFVETRLTHAIPMGIREAGRRFSNLNQGGLPVDIAEAITFLASPGAAGMQGNVLRVCGGNLLGA